MKRSTRSKSLVHSGQTSGQFIVCHYNVDDALNRVCMISADGRHIVHSHGGQPGSDTGQYDVPCHLAVDNNEFVFVADINNWRVTLLSPDHTNLRAILYQITKVRTDWAICSRVMT